MSIEQERLKSSEFATKILNDNDDDDLDLDDFESHADNMIFMMRTQAEFFGYPKLMEMSRNFNKLKTDQEKESFLSKIDLKTTKKVDEAFGEPSTEMLKMLFDWIAPLDQDFLLACANNIKDTQTTMLFEGMVYMGLAMDEEDEMDEIDEVITK